MNGKRLLSLSNFVLFSCIDTHKFLTRQVNNPLRDGVSWDHNMKSRGRTLGISGWDVPLGPWNP